jgi:hypothetical protein
MISTQRCKGKAKVRSRLSQPRIKTSRPPAQEKVGAVTAGWRIDRVLFFFFFFFYPKGLFINVLTFTALDGCSTLTALLCKEHGYGYYDTLLAELPHLQGTYYSFPPGV